jgi:hypothetical protein
VGLARFLVGFHFVIFIYNLVHFVFICLLLYLRVALFWFILFDMPPCTQAFPNLFARTLVVAGLSVASVCNSPGCIGLFPLVFSGSYPGGFNTYPSPATVCGVLRWWCGRCVGWYGPGKKKCNCWNIWYIITLLASGLLHVWFILRPRKWQQCVSLKR